MQVIDPSSPLFVNLNVVKTVYFNRYFSPLGGTGVIGFELRRQYPEMDVTVVEMKIVVKLAEERFVAGNKDLGVKFMSGMVFKFAVQIHFRK